MTISKSARFFSVAILLVVSSQATLQAQSFTLHPNGKTVLCSGATFGQSGSVGGVTYTKRTMDQITAANASTTCTSGITDMNYLFGDQPDFNGDVSTWDVSSVTDMNSMFSYAGYINGLDNIGDLSYWDVSNVTDMGYMFGGAQTFNGDISTWDVSAVTNMADMFNEARAFNRYIGAWDVSNVTTMSGMFNGALDFNQDLRGWCVSGIASAPNNFNTSSALVNNPAWGTCPTFKRLANGVTVGCSTATDGQSGTVGGVTYTRRPVGEIDASNAATSCTSGITNMSSLFEGQSTFNADITTWDVSAVTNMGSMFKNASAFNGNISTWDVSDVTNMSQMFSGATAFNQDLGGWCVAGIASEPSQFSNSSGLRSYQIPVWGTCSPFKKLSNGVTVVCSSAAIGDTGALGDATYTKRTRAQILADPSLAATSCTSGITDMSSLFSNQTTFNGDLSSWDVSNVTTMESMFASAHAFNQNLSSWDLSNVTNMIGMFSSAYAFNQNLSGWNVSAVTTMVGMFSYATAFNGNISSWDVSNVTTMRAMFNTARAFNGDISSWDVSNVTTMAFLFNDANAFNQDLSEWCVYRIATRPSYFSTSSGLSLANAPAWGTCPFVQRVISGDAGWRLISFPITGGTISDISDDTPIQGISGGANPTAAPNVYLYDDSGVFETPADVSTPFGDGKGVAVYFFNNANASSSVLPVRLDATGAQPSGDVTVSLNGAYNGYHLVGNPYASNFLADATNLVDGSSIGLGQLYNNIHFWNDGAGSYSVQDRTAPYIVRPWQGFWVQNTISTTLTFKATGKTTSTATGAFFSKEVAQATNRADLRFTLTSGRSYDEAIRLSLRDNATIGHDLDDAGKLLPLLPAYAILGFASNNMLKSVESLPWGLTESVTIPMQQTLVGVDGGFTLAWSGMESFPSGWDLTLHDYQTGVDTDMRADTSYTFDADAPAAKVSPLTLFDQLAPTLKKPAVTGTRFALTVNPNTGVVSTETDNTPLSFALDQNYPNPFNPTTTIVYTLREAGPVSLSIYTMTGQIVATLVNESQAAGQHRHSWDARGFVSGVYYYRLRANGMDVTRKMTLIK